MNVSLEPDDIEPWDADERLDHAYGHYHIGREDETRDELALFFDTRWLPEPDFLEVRLWSIVNQNDGRFIAFSKYASDAHSDNPVGELLRANIRPARTPLLPEDVLTVAVVELERSAVEAVDTALQAYSAYVGFGDISWPNYLRSTITRQMRYC
ncbi:hypothetical protein [Sphingomonas mesophila]|uniref:hypothetical protein n=1 Tax=Sphingomonas mesophila TaxID=2303576 RepID=UPI000E597824|nr:hypothetical protein [Sphingomonas mesophila]